MSQIVEFYDEDHSLSVFMVADFLGMDEDGAAQYKILHGVDPSDSRHELCDLSLERW